MAAHRKTRRGWKGWLAAAVVAVLLTAEAVTGFIFLVVAIEIARTL